MNPVDGCGTIARRSVMRLVAVTLQLLAVACAVHAANEQDSIRPQPAHVAAEIRKFRSEREGAIVAELVEFLRIPNVATSLADMTRNAELLRAMLTRRRFEIQMLEAPGHAPVVLGRLTTPGAARTVLFYSHYDGQPADAVSWLGTEPFVPALRTAPFERGGVLIPFPDEKGRYEDEWRLYARSASDDKSPIVAILVAIDALRALSIPLRVNVTLVLDGEEEAGSPTLESTLHAHRELLAGDLLVLADGPVHQNGSPLVDFGNRGIVSVRITTYGPAYSLHSGHYGNWAPNPALRLAQLLASMKDSDGRVLIAGFYDDAVPLGPAEQQAIRDAPKFDSQLLREFELAKADGGGQSLLELITQPSLNIDGLSSGWTGEQAKTIIPDSATAWLDLRLVKNIQPARQVARLITHVEGNGYYVVRDRDPSAGERARFARIARIDADQGYPAASTRMDLPAAEALLEVVDAAAGERAIRMPPSGGSVPMHVFEELGLPVIGVPMVNFDNHQHAANENLRLGNLWRGLEIYGAILACIDW